MQLSSSVFSNGETIPRRFTCDGEDLSPPFQWREPPKGTRSFVLLCNDPDAPSGTFHHWALYDIPADRTELAQGFDRSCEKEGLKRAINDFSRLGYRGPCPPHRHGPHHYHFRLLSRLIICRCSKDHPAARSKARRANIYSPRQVLSEFTRDEDSTDRSESLAMSPANAVTPVLL